MSSKLISPEQAANEGSGFFAPASAMPAVAAKQRQLNRAQKPAYIPPAIKRESEERSLFIFSLWPRLLEGNSSSYGRMMIPACLPGKDHGEPLRIAGMPHEYYNVNGNRMEAQFHGDGEMPEPGWDFAVQVLGGYTHPGRDGKPDPLKFEGRNLQKAASLERMGVGIARQWPPSKQEIEFARAKKMQNYAELCQEANEAHARGRFSQIATDVYFEAAHALGKTPAECRWLELSAAAEPDVRQNCPLCAKPYDAGTVKHDCGFILDKKQYDEWVKQGMVAAAKT